MNSLTSFLRMRLEGSAISISKEAEGASGSQAETLSRSSGVDSKGLKAGDVLVVSTQATANPGPVDKIFRWGTQAVQGGLTHAAIYVGNNKIVEARLGEGVTLKHVDDALQGKSFVALRPQLAPSTRKNAAEFAKKQVGKAYDDVGLAMAAVGAFLPESAAKLLDTGARRDRESWVCANLVTAAYAKARLTTLRGILAPADLRTSPKMTHVKTVVVDPEHMSDVSLGRLSGVAKVATLSDKLAEIEYHGKTFPGYNQPVKSDSADKKMMVLAKKGDEVRLIHFGQKGYQHNYSPEAKQNYLTRSAGIRNKSGQLTKDDPFSPNYWARKVLWPKGETGHGHNGPVNTEVRMQRKEAGLFAEDKFVDSPFGKIHDMDHSYAVDHLPMHTDDPHITRDAIIKGIAATPKPTFTPGGFFEDRRKRNYERDLASWNRTRDPDYLRRLAMDVAHNGDPSVFGAHPEKKAGLFMKEPSVTQPGFMGNLQRASLSMGMGSRSQLGEFNAARKSGALTRMGGLSRTAPPAPKMASAGLLASLIERKEDEKLAAAFKLAESENFSHGAELAGLGILGIPTAASIAGHAFHSDTLKRIGNNEALKHGTEAVGLGTLAAPSIAHFLKKRKAKQGA